MKKEIYNIVFLGAVIIALAWLYWPASNDTNEATGQGRSSFILAVSWQPAFCEKRPNRPECRSQREGRRDADHFSLHGLWPQPRDNVYCDVPNELEQASKRGRWRDLPALDLSEKTRDELSSLMPGYRSFLHRHEWYKHGTCMKGTPQTYFEISNHLLNDLNQTGLRDLFARNIGKEISAREIQAAIRQAYGDAASERVTVSCNRDGGRTLIDELKISYAFDPATVDFNDIGVLLAEAQSLPIGCKSGIVDPVGLQ